MGFWIRWFNRLAGLLLWFLLVIWGLLGLSALFLHGWLAPNVDRYRSTVQTQLQEQLGVPVRIGAIVATSQGAIPGFELQSVQLLDPQGQPALTLPSIKVALSPKSLLRLGFEQIHIDSPVLDIRRTKDGHILIAGLDMSQTQSDNEGALDWFFSQPELVIRNGQLRWLDQWQPTSGQLQPPPQEALVLTNVDFVTRNPLGQHQLRLDATPPADWGSRFSLQGDFSQSLFARDKGRFEEWTGTAYADFAAIDVRHLSAYLRQSDQTYQGRGALRAWLQWEGGQVQDLKSDFSMQAIDLTLGKGVQPLQLAQASGRIAAKELPYGFALQTQNLQFTTTQGLRWPGGNVAMTYQSAHDDTPAKAVVHGAALDLAALTQIANSLPLPAKVRDQLQTLKPTGRIDDVQAQWQGTWPKFEALDVRLQASNLGVAAIASTNQPGFAGLSLNLRADLQGGQAQLSMKDGQIDLPGVFEESRLALQSMSGDISWRLDTSSLAASPKAATPPSAAPDIRVQVHKLQFANADAAGELSGQWRTQLASDVPKTAMTNASPYPGIVELQGQLLRADVTRVWRYLPTVIPVKVRQYVRESVVSGQASNTRFTLKGNLNDMPFKDSKTGLFRISTDANDVRLNYVPRFLQNPDDKAWPAFERIQGQLVFEGQGMQVRNAKARITGLPNVALDVPNLDIADFEQGVLTTDGRAIGTVAEMLQFVNNSPVDDLLQNALQNVQATGQAQYQLNLRIPLSNPHQTTMAAQLDIKGGQVLWSAETPKLTQVNGRVTHTHQSLDLQNINANVYGGSAVISGGLTALGDTGAVNASGGPSNPSSPAPVLIRARGMAQASSLQAAPELAAFRPLLQRLSGQSAYDANIAVRQGKVDLTIQSPLQGVAVDLPAPLGKTADTALPLRIEHHTSSQSRGLVRVNLGNVLAANYLRDVSGTTPKVLRGSIALGADASRALTPNRAGVQAAIALDNLNLDQWISFGNALRGSSSAGSSSPSALTTSSANAPATMYQGAESEVNAALVEQFIPSDIVFRTKVLQVQGRSFNAVRANISHNNKVWKAQVDAQELRGSLEYHDTAPSGKVVARLSQLQINPADAKQVEQVINEQPQTMPELDLEVTDLTYQGKPIEKFSFKGKSIGRRWKITELIVQLPAARLTAGGDWDEIESDTQNPKRRRTTLGFVVKFDDAGDVLSWLGMDKAIRRGQGELTGSLNWVGSPISLDLGSLGGNVSLDVKAGQFLKAEPGVARLLGVLNLQSIPKFLTLDFRDVFSEGFAFDTIKGRVLINNGLARTDPDAPLQMSGLNALVEINGQADVVKETQNIRVVIVPEINANSLIAAAIVNPAVGIGAFLTQLLLKDPLISANTRQFQVDGTWSAPKVIEIPRNQASSVTPSTLPTAPPSQPAPAPTPQPAQLPVTTAPQPPSNRSSP